MTTKITVPEKAEKWLKIIASMIGSIIVIVGAIQWGVGIAMGPINDKMDAIEASTTRSELLLMIEHYPEDVRGITMLAEKYFIDLGQDSYMFNIYCDWAKEHKVDVSEIKTIHDLQKK